MKGFIYLAACASLFGPGNASTARPRARDDDGTAACKAFPGTPAWPSEETWAKFNQSLGGKLIQPGAPPGAVCHPGQPTFDPDKCVSVTAAWRTYIFHQNDPVSNMWQQFNNDTCLVDPNTPCSPAGYPAYVVNATTAQDVKLGLDFARKHNVRVVVKSSGHDYQGRSQAPGALSIWVHHMQSHELHDSFRPTGCDFTIETPAITVGGGSQLGPIYDDLGKINRTIVGGNSRTVSVGGYLTGGGHSILAPHYGMGADFVLELEVVTPKGEILTANECQNQDLFWAMRGGGGSTFGVMTSVTLATHPTPKIVGGEAGVFTVDLKAPWLWDMIGYVLSQVPYLTEKGVTGYTFITENFTAPAGGNSTFDVAGIVGEFMIIDTQNPADMAKIWQPIFKEVQARWPAAYPYVTVEPYASFSAWFKKYDDLTAAGYDQYTGSRLLDEKAFTSYNSTYLGQVFKNSGGSPYLVAGKGVQNAKPRGGSTAVSPAWRKALAHVVNGVSFAPLNATAKQEALDKVDKRTEPLRKIAPDMGAYVNENYPGERDWQKTYWGDNYERLLKIKRTVDPNDVLWCHPCVGNDRWEQKGYRLCPVKNGGYSKNE